MAHTLRTRSLLAVPAIALLSLGLVAAESSCEGVAGDYTTVFYVGPDCPTPVPQCFHATVNGGLDGTARSWLRGLAPAPTPDAPTRTVWATSHLFSLAGGTLSTEDVAIIDLSATGPSPVDITLRILDGTDAFAGASGTLRGIATFDFTKGEGGGVYDGVVCRE